MSSNQQPDDTIEETIDSDDELFRSEFDKVWDTLKVRWRIPRFRNLGLQATRSPGFQSPVDAANEFWLELTFVTGNMEDSASDSRARFSSQSDQQTVICLHIRRQSGGQIVLKYLIGMGGPNGTMKVLTQDGQFDSRKDKFGGSVVQLSKVVHPAASYLTPDASLVVYAELRILSPESRVDQWTRDRVFQLLSSKHFTDMIVVTDGVELRTHRLLVASSSPLFLQQLQQQEADGQEFVIKLDEELLVVKCWLSFLTTGSLESLPAGEEFKLLHFSRLHQIPSLRLATVNRMVENLTVDNVIQVTRNAHMYDCTNLLEACLSFIGKHVRGEK